MRTRTSGEQQQRHTDQRVERTLREIVDEDAAARLAGLEALLVLSARKFASDDHRITLQGLSAATLFVADRPHREIGHLRTRQLIELWGAGEHSLADEPPTAILSFFDPLLEPGVAPPPDVSVVLRGAQLRGDTLAMPVQILDGALPRETGGCLVYVEVTGRPGLAPLALVHRRPRSSLTHR